MPPLHDYLFSHLSNDANAWVQLLSRLENLLILLSLLNPAKNRGEQKAIGDLANAIKLINENQDELALGNTRLHSGYKTDESSNNTDSGSGDSSSSVSYETSSLMRKLSALFESPSPVIQTLSSMSPPSSGQSTTSTIGRLQDEINDLSNNLALSRQEYQNNLRQQERRHFQELNALRENAIVDPRIQELNEKHEKALQQLDYDNVEEKVELRERLYREHREEKERLRNNIKAEIEETYQQAMMKLEFEQLEKEQNLKNEVTQKFLEQQNEIEEHKKSIMHQTAEIERLNTILNNGKIFFETGERQYNQVLNELTGQQNVIEGLNNQIANLQVELGRSRGTDWEQLNQRRMELASQHQVAESNLNTLRNNIENDRIVLQTQRETLQRDREDYNRARTMLETDRELLRAEREQVAETQERINEMDRTSFRSEEQNNIAPSRDMPNPVSINVPRVYLDPEHINNDQDVAMQENDSPDQEPSISSFSLIANAMRFCTRTALSNIPNDSAFLNEIQKIFREAFSDFEVDSWWAQFDGNGAQFLPSIYAFIREERPRFPSERLRERSSAVAMTILVQCMMGRKHTPPSHETNVPPNFMYNIRDTTIQADQRMDGHTPSDEVLVYYIWTILNSTDVIESTDQFIMRDLNDDEKSYDNTKSKAAIRILEKARGIYQNTMRRLLVNDGYALQFYHYPNGSNDRYTMAILEPNVTWEMWYDAVIRMDETRKREQTTLLLLMLGALYVYAPDANRVWILRALAVAPHLIYTRDKLINGYLVNNDDGYPYNEQ